MTVTEMAQLFDKPDNFSQFCRFSDVVNPPSLRSDLCGMLLLDRLCPSSIDMLIGAGVGRVDFDVNAEDVARVITEAQVIYLLQCGILFDPASETFYTNC